MPLPQSSSQSRLTSRRARDDPHIIASPNVVTSASPKSKRNRHREDVVIHTDPREITYCEGEFYSYSHEGDSGGPTFVYDGYEGASLAGIENAVDCINYSCGTDEGKGVLFSYWSSVLYDLGALDPLHNTTVGVPSLTGSISGGGNAVVNWSAVSTTNTSATTQYLVYQSTWDASTTTWVESNHYITTTTSLSYTDMSTPFALSAVTGSTEPDHCTYSAIAITIRAYNQGASAYSATMWFQGPANGPGGFIC